MASHGILTTGIVAAVFGAAACAQCSSLTNAPPGTSLPLLDESVRTAALGFSFRFHGVAYDRVTIADNGYLWLGDAPAQGAVDSSDSGPELLAAPPRLAPCWDDFAPGDAGMPAGGGIFFRSDGEVANIVWHGVPRYGSTVLAEMEVVLCGDTHPTARNEIWFVYGAAMAAPESSCIVGISAGNGAASPPSSQPPGRPWTQFASAGGTAIGATAYQQFTAASGAAPFDLAGRTLHFVPVDPVAAGDYGVTFAAMPPCAPGNHLAAASTPQLFGVGCPVPNGSIYEPFTADGGGHPLDLAGLGLAGLGLEFVRAGGDYTLMPGPAFDAAYAANGTQLPMGDETVVPGLAVGAMGAFPFGSTLVPAVAACANGYLWLGPTGPADFSPSGLELTLAPPRVAPLWMDLDLGAGGLFWWENQDPTFCRATWVGAREYQQSAAHTFQVTLRSNGNVAFSYGTMTGAIAQPSVVGLSGGVGYDQGQSDLAVGAGVGTAVRRLTGGSPPFLHFAAAPAAIGTALPLAAIVPSLPPGGTLGLFLLGFTSPGVPLAALGMPDCTLYAALDVLLPTLFATQPTAFAVSVPYDPAFVGVTLYSQAAALLPLNAAGWVASNGVVMTLGR